MIIARALRETIAYGLEVDHAPFCMFAAPAWRLKIAAVPNCLKDQHVDGTSNAKMIMDRICLCSWGLTASILRLRCHLVSLRDRSYVHARMG